MSVPYYAKGYGIPTAIADDFMTQMTNNVGKPKEIAARKREAELILYAALDIIKHGKQPEWIEKTKYYTIKRIIAQHFDDLKAQHEEIIKRQPQRRDDRPISYNEYKAL